MPHCKIPQPPRSPPVHLPRAPAGILWEEDWQAMAHTLAAALAKAFAQYKAAAAAAATVTTTRRPDTPKHLRTVLDHSRRLSAFHYFAGCRFPIQGGWDWHRVNFGDQGRPRTTRHLSRS